LLAFGEECRGDVSVVPAHDSDDGSSKVPTDIGGVSPGRNVSTDYFAMVAVQLLICAMFAPGDGGRWFAYTVILLVCFDVVVYFVLISGLRKYRTGWLLLAMVLVAGSLVVSMIGTLITTYT
jgi:hypothetical protein